MISKMTIQVAWYDWQTSVSKIRIEITPGSVENVVGDGMPLSLYMEILKALQQVEDKINGKAAPPVETPAPQPRIEVPPLPQEAVSTPPTPKTVGSAASKKPKRFTVEEKTEIAMMYANGQSIKSIAEKFGRTEHSIRLLVSKMGVKRGDNPVASEQAEASKPASKGESKLKKPWYLK